MKPVVPAEALLLKLLQDQLQLVAGLLEAGWVSVKAKADPLHPLSRPTAAAGQGSPQAEPGTPALQPQRNTAGGQQRVVFPKGQIEAFEADLETKASRPTLSSLNGSDQPPAGSVTLAAVVVR